MPGPPAPQRAVPTPRFRRGPLPAGWPKAVCTSDRSMACCTLAQGAPLTLRPALAAGSLTIRKTREQAKAFRACLARSPAPSPSPPAPPLSPNPEKLEFRAQERTAGNRSKVWLGQPLRRLRRQCKPCRQRLSNLGEKTEKTRRTRKNCRLFTKNVELFEITPGPANCRPRRAARDAET